MYPMHEIVKKYLKDKFMHFIINPTYSITGNTLIFIILQLSFLLCNFLEYTFIFFHKYCDALHLFFLSELSNHVELMKDKDRLVFRAKRCTYIVRCILSMYLKHKFRLFI